MQTRRLIPFFLAALLCASLMPGVTGAARAQQQATSLSASFANAQA